MRATHFARLAGVTALVLAAAVAGGGAAGQPERHHHTQQAAPAAGPARARIATGDVHQTIDGFGASHLPVARDGEDALGADLRRRALAAVYEQVRLTAGIIDTSLTEQRGGQKDNDNDDPATIDWDGFDHGTLDAFKALVLERPEAAAFDGYVFGQRINTRWGSPWLARLREHDFHRYVDEAAEQVVAGELYWRDRLHLPPPWVLLFNEPLSGNHELEHGETRDLAAIVARTGTRLTEAGLPNVRFVVPNEETADKSYDSASSILGNRAARRFVGAIGYHPYPYESAYANIPRLLATSGLGRPDPDEVGARHDLRDLARKYHVPLWMTEVSNGGVSAVSYDAFRGRANHIHDELTIADASAYFAMFAMWDRRSQQRHFGSDDAFLRAEGNVVLVDNVQGEVHITGMGYAIGHFARWLHRGARRVEADASDRLLKVSAFIDADGTHLVIVAINNASSARPVAFTVEGQALDGEMTGEQSTLEAYWTPLPPSEVARDGFTLQVPALSVTSLRVPIRQEPPSRP